MMNELYKKFFLPILFTVVFISGCKEDDAEPELLVSISELTIPVEGTKVDITISCNEKWRINNPAEWLVISAITGNSGATTIELSAPPNTIGTTRSAILMINSDNGQARRLAVSQVSELYPSYNLSPKPPDAT